MDLSLVGKRVLVTGGSRGIGRSIVTALLQQGAVVAATYHRESEAAESLVKELEERRNGSFAAQVDVSDATSVSALATHVKHHFDLLDSLINNASIIGQATVSELELADWQNILDTNLTSVYLVTRAMLDVLAEGGSIINISSNLAAVGMRGKAHYTASKAGVIGFSRSLCKEVGARGIRVNVVAPGVIETEQIDNLTPEQRKRYAYLSALGRMGQPEEVATVVLFLSSDLSRFVTGTTIAVDGGVGGISAL